jgi:iron complex transport system permease protein
VNQGDEKLKATLPGWKLALWLVAMPVLAGGVWCACSLIGRYELSWDIWRLRAFRLTAAGIVGAALAAGGMALQGLMRNPLAEPYILGISSGAGVGVLLGLGLGEWLDWPGWIDTPVMAMVGALATSGVVYGVAQRRGRLDPYVLLLSGVIVNVLNGAIIYAILLFLRPNQLLSFIGWGMGRVPDSLWVQPNLVIFCAVWVAGAGRC